MLPQLPMTISETEVTPGYRLSCCNGGSGNALRGVTH
jgi:hypothetical protein